jgi:hypothetical protein
MAVIRPGCAGERRDRPTGAMRRVGVGHERRSQSDDLRGFVVEPQRSQLLGTLQVEAEWPAGMRKPAPPAHSGIRRDAEDAASASISAVEGGRAGSEPKGGAPSNQATDTSFQTDTWSNGGQIPVTDRGRRWRNDRLRESHG